MFDLEFGDVQCSDRGTVQLSRLQLRQLATEAGRVFLAGQTEWMSLEMGKAQRKIVKNQRSLGAKALALLTGGPLMGKKESLEQAAKRHVEEQNYWKLSLDRDYLQIPQEALALVNCMTEGDVFTLRKESYYDMAKMASGAFNRL